MKLHFRALALALVAPMLAHANVLVDRSGTVVTGGVAVTAMTAKTSRTYLACQNPVAATTTLFVRVDGTASTTAGSFELAPGGSITWANGFVPTGAVSVTSATTGARFVCSEG